MSKSPNFISMGTDSTSGVSLTDDRQIIDLDDHYDDKATEEETKAIAEYLSSGKLSKKALQAQNVEGQERFEPGTTVLNGVLGGESFLQSIVKGAADFVKKVIKMIADAARWLTEKVRQFTTYFSDIREIQKTEEMMREIEAKLMELGGPSMLIPNVEELFGKDKVVARRVSVVRMLRDRNKTVIEAAAKLSESSPQIKELILSLNSQEFSARRVKDQFDKSVAHIRKRFKENSLTLEDVTLWEAQVSDLVAQNLQPHKLKASFSKLASIVSLDQELSDTVQAEDRFAEFYETLRKNQELAKEELSVKDFAAFAQQGNAMRDMVAQNPGEFDIAIKASDLKELDQVVSMSDLDFFTTIGNALGSPRPVAVYRDFVARCSDYVKTLRICVETAVRYTEEIKYVAEWAQRYQLILNVYSLSNASNREEKIKEIEKETGKSFDGAGIDSVVEDGLDKTERAWRAAYERMFPRLKDQMNRLSRKLNAGVTVK
ncbi:virion structural protein [Vibrio phage Aphrodite1]|uniref:Tail length tape-measure protein n=1 Tax=Vibrio phage Aphrodite1 TaxID=2070057 RepID=A0A2I7QHV0_9CAUD|nr:virion structural protein [Vibrio phage Aphrodite1]AUR80948.1 tail length tape-measure protein [Vibrio phage Aphrodite1]